MRRTLVASLGEGNENGDSISLRVGEVAECACGDGEKFEVVHLENDLRLSVLIAQGDIEFFHSSIAKKRLFGVVASEGKVIGFTAVFAFKSGKGMALK